MSPARAYSTFFGVALKLGVSPIIPVRFVTNLPGLYRVMPNERMKLPSRHEGQDDVGRGAGGSQRIALVWARSLSEVR